MAWSPSGLPTLLTFNRGCCGAQEADSHYRDDLGFIHVEKKSDS